MKQAPSHASSSAQNVGRIETAITAPTRITIPHPVFLDMPLALGSRAIPSIVIDAPRRNGRSVISSLVC